VSVVDSTVARRRKHCTACWGVLCHSHRYHLSNTYTGTTYVCMYICMYVFIYMSANVCVRCMYVSIYLYVCTYLYNIYICMC
jgi:hypothetical protein